MTQKNPVDEEFDTRWGIGANGYGDTCGFKPTPADALVPDLKAFASANNGKEPTDPSQLLPYVSTPDQQATLQKLIKTSGAKTIPGQ